MICLQLLFLKKLYCSDVHWCALTWDLQLQCVRGQTDDRMDDAQLWLSFLAQTNSILIHNHPQTVIQQTLGSQWPLCHLLGQSQQQSTCHENVSGYVCNHGSPSGERDTASPRGRYGGRPQRDSVWRYIWKNTTCWPATAHDVTTGVPQYKCRREDTSSASSSEACVRSMAQSPGDAVSRSPLGEPWLHT